MEVVTWADLFALEESPEVPKKTKDRVFDIFYGLLRKLSPREERVLRMRSGLGSSGEILTLEEIGNLFGITRQRTKAIESRAIAKLERMLSEIPDYS